MKLDENYTVLTDENQFQLSYRREKEVEKNGEIKTVIEKRDYFYPKLSQCLSKYLNESLKECNSIEEVLRRISEVENKIDKI